MCLLISLLFFPLVISRVDGVAGSVQSGRVIDCSPLQPVAALLFPAECKATQQTRFLRPPLLDSKQISIRILVDSLSFLVSLALRGFLFSGLRSS